ncbi:uncharacterized protein LOC128557039 [Mercenaria mercenaria]|uniref:uncharacterized protein LOC128557039 n=1 Tax=Mercenaria mercenaria TaxID=6596 RepID=UPI00234EC4B8|nr:uncharacterized protein LOC128557039 [Mercenaria mercenaria]
MVLKTFHELLKGERGYALYLADISQMSIREATKTLVETVNEILNEFEDKTDYIVSKFVIGKTYAPQVQEENETYQDSNVSTWNDEGVISRWNTKYKNAGFNGMLVLCGITCQTVKEMIRYEASNDSDSEIVSDSDSDDDDDCELSNQQDYTLALEQRLIHHFAYVKHDHRLGNETLCTGRRGPRDAAGVVYLVYKF